MIKKILVLILFSTITYSQATLVNAQMLSDTAAMELVKRDIDFIYNSQFDSARSIHAEICKLYPQHPVSYLLNGLIIYWENYPLLHSSPESSSFESDMTQCIELCEKNNRAEYDAEYLLASLSSRGMLLLYYSDNDLSSKVFPLTISTYQYIRRSFDFTSKCTDLYYFTGIYNYYREAYPRIYPVYKPLAALFPKGDAVTGLKHLSYSAEGSVVMGPESYFMLSWVQLNFENNYSQSLHFCRILHENYPRNPLYLSDYIRNLLLLKRYDEAEKVITEVQDSVENKYLSTQLIIYKGLLQEKKYRNYTLAQQYYNKGIFDLSAYGDYANESAASAYFGLSRIAEARGEKNISRRYRNEALKRADFKKVNFD